MNAPDVWIAKEDGSDIFRATAIVGIGIGYNGNITAQVGHGEGTTITLADPGREHGTHPADDFHRQLIRIIAQLSDASGAFLVRPEHDEKGDWHWVTEPL
jgi:hypothetical protein